MTCRLQAVKPRDCVEVCDDCVCDLTAPAPLPAALLAHAKAGAPPRLGDWMQTFTGRQYWPADPRPEDVDIRDIAHALSLQCRYGGHAVRFYSVAEHCVVMARSQEYRLSYIECMALLMHDASEAYLVDVPRPIKPSLAGYGEIEERNMVAIADRFGIEWPMPKFVKWADNAILHDERAQVMAPCAADWQLPGESLGVTLPFWPPQIAEAEFLRAFADFGGVR